MCVRAQLLSRAWLFTTPWTVAHQALLSIGFSQQGYWSGLPFSPPGGLPNPGIKPTSPALAGRFFTIEPPGKPTFITNLSENFTETMNLFFLYIQTHSYCVSQKVLWVRWWKTWMNFLANRIISSWRCLLKPLASVIWSGQPSALLHRGLCPLHHKDSYHLSRGCIHPFLDPMSSASLV